MTMWHQEIDDLHEVFEQYFLGTTDTLERVEAALAADFAIVAPDGRESSRAQTLQALQAAHAHATSFSITIAEPRLLIETDEVVVASYLENQQTAGKSTSRLSTVIFTKNEDAPNGLAWRRVHETWVV